MVNETTQDTHYTRSGEVTIAYQVHGKGEIDLLLIPGFVSHMELIWDEPATAWFLRRLASFSRLILFDKRGQGLSDRTGRPPTLEESMGDALAVLDAAGSQRAAILGVSEGGPVAALCAATYPHQVSALALYGTYARLLRAADYPAGVSEPRFDAWQRQVAAEWGGPVLVSMWAPSHENDPAFGEWWARFLRQGTSPGGAVELMDLYREIDVRRTLSAIDVPTLVLHRAGDRLIPPRQGRYLADHIPGARYVELPGDDHLISSGAVDPLLDELALFLVGTRGAHEPERALATVVFTDIVDSTKRAAAVGDRRWGALSEGHDAIVRERLQRYRGEEIKTLGDGFLAVFDAPARAIRFAQDIRDRLRALGLEVRTGLHTGEVERVNGDIRGISVNIGARVGARAGAGEVLVSSTVKDLVVGSGLSFRDRGEHELKGVPDKWRLFAVDG